MLHVFHAICIASKPNDPGPKPAEQNPTPRVRVAGRLFTDVQRIQRARSLREISAGPSQPDPVGVCRDRASMLSISRLSAISFALHGAESLHRRVCLTAIGLQWPWETFQRSAQAVCVRADRGVEASVNLPCRPFPTSLFQSSCSSKVGQPIAIATFPSSARGRAVIYSTLHTSFFGTGTVRAHADGVTRFGCWRL